ncbi:MAG: YicC family protein [Flavobacteriales bacterium]|nr:YicC family protein [Flavobacteriales bacterium]
MIHSMTGYGKSTATIGMRRYTAEVRSLNGKQLDLSVRMPSAFREKEMELRKALSKAIGRGKCDLSLHYEADGIERKELNSGLIAAYLEDLEGIAKGRGYEQNPGALMQVAMRLPDVLQQGKEELNENEWGQIQALIDDAVSNFLSFRVHEGEALEADFRQHVANISEMEEKIGPILDERIKRIRSRIQANFNEIQDRGRLDENRFEQEVLFYLEKLDVSEERVRLKAHCTYFIEVLEQPAGQAKKLGFIAQEMGREINTLGSKANDADMQRYVVQMKDELEKIKEQVLNAL